MDAETAQRLATAHMTKDARADELGRRQDPSAEIKERINALSEQAVCAQQYTVTWTYGPKKGLPVTVYCVEPLCVNTGKCEGQRFVPHMQQYTTIDTDDPRWGPRKISKREAIAAVREVSKRAESQGAIKMLWDDKAIWNFIQLVWRKTLKAVQGDGQDPRRGWTR